MNFQYKKRQTNAFWHNPHAVPAEFQYISQTYDPTPQEQEELDKNGFYVKDGIKYKNPLPVKMGKPTIENDIDNSDEERERNFEIESQKIEMFFDESEKECNNIF
jgi:hypothetical protein